MKSFSLFLLICISVAGFSQKTLVELPIKLRRSFTDKREAYSYIDSRTGNLVLFLMDNKTAKVYRFNEKFEVIDSLNSLRPDFENVIGCSGNADGYDLIFASEGYSNLKVINFNFERKFSFIAPVDLGFSKEKYAGSFIYKGTTYLFTAIRGKSALKLYELTRGASFKKYEFDFGDERFGSGYDHSLFDVLKDDPAVFVDNSIPNPVDIGSKKNKLYVTDSLLVMTLDNQVMRTALINIDLSKMKSSLTFFSHNIPTCDGSPTTGSGSYVYKNNLFQISVCFDGMVSTVLDLTTGKVLKEYRATSSDDEIPFSNSTIRFKKTDDLYGDVDKVLSKTKQFMRKVSTLDPGVVAYGTSAGLQITFGGAAKVVYTNSNPVVWTGGGPGGGMMMSSGGGLSFVPTFNPVYYGYNSYKVSRAVYFNGLFDEKTFVHKEGVIPKNAFDKIEEFSKPIEDDIALETIFKKDDQMIYGYYLKPARQYVLRAFSEQAAE
jgi:hypothetical protein